MNAKGCIATGRIDLALEHLYEIEKMADKWVQDNSIGLLNPKPPPFVKSKKPRMTVKEYSDIMANNIATVSKATRKTVKPPKNTNAALKLARGSKKKKKAK